jgi:hypothetical protein
MPLHIKFAAVAHRVGGQFLGVAEKGVKFLILRAVWSYESTNERKVVNVMRRKC